MYGRAVTVKGHSPAFSGRFSLFAPLSSAVPGFTEVISDVDDPSGLVVNLNLLSAMSTDLCARGTRPCDRPPSPPPDRGSQCRSGPGLPIHTGGSVPFACTPLFIAVYHRMMKKQSRGDDLSQK